jgi:hypothetical protein
MKRILFFFIIYKLLNKEIKFLSNRLDEIRLIIMRDDQFVDQYIGANTYSCS